MNSISAFFFFKFFNDSWCLLKKTIDLYVDTVLCRILMFNTTLYHFYAKVTFMWFLNGILFAKLA